MFVCLLACLFVCLSFCLFVCLSGCLLVCLFVPLLCCPCICMSTCLLVFVCLLWSSVCLFRFCSVCFVLSACLLVCLFVFVCPCVCFVCLSVCVFALSLCVPLSLCVVDSPVATLLVSGLLYRRKICRVLSSRPLVCFICVFLWLAVCFCSSLSTTQKSKQANKQKNSRHKQRV